MITQEKYDRIAFASLNGDFAEFETLTEAEKDYFRKNFEEWEGKHCVCAVPMEVTK